MLSNESGKFEIYARPFPSGGGPISISNNGGSNPRWRADGKELYYLEGQDYFGGSRISGRSHAIQRFLMNVLTDASLPSLNVITNWGKLVPGPARD